MSVADVNLTKIKQIQPKPFKNDLLLFVAKWKERCSLDLLKFLIFLYIQHAHNISIKASMVVGEEYPFLFMKVLTALKPYIDSLM